MDTNTRPLKRMRSPVGASTVQATNTEGCTPAPPACASNSAQMQQPASATEDCPRAQARAGTEGSPTIPHRVSERPKEQSQYPAQQQQPAPAEVIRALEDGLQELCGATCGKAPLPIGERDERCLRSELINRYVLSSLYGCELAGVRITSCSGRGCCAAASDSGVGAVVPNTMCKAMNNCERALVLASHLCEPRTLVYFAVGLAELHIARRDLPAATATFDACVAACGGLADAGLRASLLQRVLPMAMEVLNMQGRTAEGFERWRTLNGVLAESGRSVPEECPICSEEFSPHRACVALSCGHSFHRDCCDMWLGHRMFATGAFCAECPVCKQVDASLKPTPAAVQALEVQRRTLAAAAMVTGHGVSGSGSRGNGDGDDDSASSSSSGSNCTGAAACGRNGSGNAGGDAAGNGGGSSDGSGSEDSGSDGESDAMESSAEGGSCGGFDSEECESIA